MALNPNNKSIDTMIKEIDNLYNNYWAHPQNKEPYSVLIEKLIQYKKAHQIQNLLLVLQNRIDSQETFLNLEQTAWTAIFVILGLFTTAISDLILAHHAELNLLNLIPKVIYVCIAIFLISVETIIYGYTILNTIRKKGSQNCYYKFVYNCLNQNVTQTLAQEKPYDIDNIYNLPEGSRAELIDGQIYYMAPPSTRHQRILSFLHLEIGNHIRSKGGTCEVFPAPFAVFLCADNSKYLEPDISVICDKGKLDEHGCKGAPDWIIEIVSPGSRAMDYYTKLSLYREAGVREYWIVDPMKQTVLVYDMEQAAAPTIYSFTDTIRTTIYDSLEIDFSKLPF